MTRPSSSGATSSTAPARWSRRADACSSSPPLRCASASGGGWPARSAPPRAFGGRVAASFSPHAEILTSEEGEANKSLDTAAHVITQLLERGAKRDSTAVVVGGGMIGDTAGLAGSGRAG